MNEPKPNFIEAFSNQKLKLRPYAIIASAATLALIIGLPVLFLLDAGSTFLTAYLVVCVVILLGCVPAVVKSSRCPACHKYMGKGVGKFCPLCGVQVEKGSP